MSATGRGTVRNDRDLYETPSWLTRAILPQIYAPNLYTKEGQILEPACGNGAITNELKRVYSLTNIITMDIAPGGDLTTDFLTTPPLAAFDLIITNPPYSLALEFCKRAMLWRRDNNSLVVMLLRINFLGGQKRARWLRANTPSIYVSPRRPSFTGHGTDATEYAWFVWGEKNPSVHILETDLKTPQSPESDAHGVDDVVP